MLRSFVVTAVLGASAIACAPEHMHAVAPDTAVPVDPHLATVVFVRPRFTAAALNFTIVDVTRDGAARFVGESAPTSHFAVNLPAGEHTFLAWAGHHEDAVHADLAAGRVYFVAILSEPFRPLELRAVRRGDGETSDAPRWIEETTALAPDREAGQRELVRDPHELEERIDDAVAEWKGLERDEVAARTLGPEDSQ
jgi:hypothetical protein